MGIDNNQENFLLTISAKLGRERLQLQQLTKPLWSITPEWKIDDRLTREELLQLLIEQCKNIHTEVIKTTSKTLNEDLLRILTSHHAQKIITWKDERFENFHIDKTLKEAEQNGMELHMWNEQLGEKNIVFAEQADIGITFADMVLAESGTIVLFSGRGRGRSVSLLPKHHLAIIPKSTLSARFTQATNELHKRKSKNLPSCILFISGPSNSADIEMNLVVGVHGPVKVTYVVIKDK